MKLARKQTIVGAMGTALVCLLGFSLVRGQAPAPAQKPQTAEEAFKNIQVLKGIPVDEFLDTMGFICASLGMTCTDCHGLASGGDWARYADETPLKKTARKMILMVGTINKDNFGGARMVTCDTCHRYDTRPAVIPSLAVQYGTPPPDDPNEVQVPRQTPGAPSPDQVFDKYIQALGGAQKVAGLASFVGKGTYEGYDTEHEKVPVDVYAKAPGLRTTVVHMRGADSTRTYDGTAGWVASPDKPVPLMPLTGGDLEGAKTDAMLSFPTRIKQAHSQWRVGTVTINDKEFNVVQGSDPGKLPLKLYFDKDSGLLVRAVRYTNTPIGTVPIQLDYRDYRNVGGVKVAFNWTTTWTDGQSTTELSEVQPNAPIAAAKFAKPAPAPSPK